MEFSTILTLIGLIVFCILTQPTDLPPKPEPIDHDEIAHDKWHEENPISDGNKFEHSSEEWRKWWWARERSKPQAVKRYEIRMHKAYQDAMSSY